MKLNPDCIRDTLLAAEQECKVEVFFSYPKPNQFLDKYDAEEVLYHIQQCEYDGLLLELTWASGPSVSIKDISPAGHRFLADIRSDTNWNKTKEIAAKVGSDSLLTLRKIAADVISSVIGKQFGV